MTLKEEVKLLREKVELLEQMKELELWLQEAKRNCPVYVPYPIYPTMPWYERPTITWDASSVIEYKGTGF